MLVADSGVWIDFFADAPHPAVDRLTEWLRDGEVRVVVPDLVLFEVLRGFRHERDFREARALLESLDVETVGGHALIDTPGFYGTLGGELALALRQVAGAHLDGRPGLGARQGRGRADRRMLHRARLCAAAPRPRFRRLRAAARPARLAALTFAPR